MRTQSICLALAIVLVCPFASAQWVRTNGPDSSIVNALAVSGTNLFAGTGTGYFGSTPLPGVFRSTNNGTNWTAVNLGLPRDMSDTTQYAGITCIASSGQNLFAGTGRGVFLSTNNGASWTAASTDLTSTYVYALSVSGTNLFAGTGDGVFLSTNDGTNWTPARDGLPQWGNNQYLGISAFTVVDTNLFAATGSNGVYLSSNNGANWVAVNAGLPRGTSYNPASYNSIACFAVSGANLFVGMRQGLFIKNDGVFLSTNNGTSWTQAGLTNMWWVFSLAVSGVNLFAGTFDGVYVSANNGASWMAVNEGLPRFRYDSTVYVPIFCFALSGQNLFVGTAGSGVWRRPLSEMITDVKSIGLLPTSYVLDQNYPNPFNPSTTIKFELPRASQVNLNIYDILGRQVSVLVNERREAGYHKVKFDGSGLSSGVYFYRIEAGSFIETRKLLLVK